MSEKLLTKKEVADLLKVTVRTLENLMARRAIDVVRIGRCVRFTQEGVDKFIAESTSRGLSI